MTLGHMIHHIYTLILPPLLPIFTVIYGLTYFQGGLLLGVLNAGMMMQLLVGFYSDRSGRRSILAGLGLVFTALVTALLALTGNFLSLLIMAFVLGVVASTFHPPGTTLVTEYFARARRGRTLGIHLIGGSVGTSLGPIIIGALIAFLIWQYTLFIIAVPGVIIGILYWHFIKDVTARSNSSLDPSASEESVAGFRLRPVMYSLIIVIAAEMLGLTSFYGVLNFLPMYLVSEFEVSVTFAALLLGMMQIAGIAGSPIGGWAADRFGRKTIIVIGLSVQPVLLYLLLHISVGLAMYLIILLIGFTVYTLVPSVSAYLADLVPSSFRATVYASYFTVVFAWMTIIPVITGNLADLVGLRDALTILVFASASGAFLSLFIRKR